jgi:hypothetical protein
LRRKWLRGRQKKKQIKKKLFNLKKPLTSKSKEKEKKRTRIKRTVSLLPTLSKRLTSKR